MMNRLKSLAAWYNDRFMCVAIVSCLLVYGMVYLGGAFGQPIRSDGEGYYAYLPAIAIQGDASFETLADLRFGGEMPSWAGFGRCAKTGRYVDIYGVGVAMMMFPFFLAAHLLTFLFRSPEGWHRFNCAADGFSFFYQHAAGLAGLFYGLAGLAMLRRALRRWFSPGVTAATLTAVLFGTNLLHYLSGESVLSHAYSFFLFAWIVLIAMRLHDGGPIQTRDYVALGVAAGLVAAVRLPNVLFLAVVALYGLNGRADWTARFLFLRRHIGSFLLAGLVACAAFSPQLIMWRFSTGRWWVNAYQEAYPALELTRFAGPRVMEVLFSLRGGALFWSPVLVFALAGFFRMRRLCPAMLLPCVGYLLPTLWLVSSWHDWAFGGGFGHRGFVEAYVLLAFPMAAVFATVAGARRRGWLLVVATGAVLMIGYSLFFQMLYYTRELSVYGLDRQALFDILWWRKQMLEEWIRQLHATPVPGGQ